MGEIDKRTDEREQELREYLAPIIGEDVNNAAYMLISALKRAFGYPVIKEEDQPRYLAALERLPRGSTADPQLLAVSHNEQWTAPHWRPSFTEGGTEYISPRHFPTDAMANMYVTKFLMALRGEINRT